MGHSQQLVLAPLVLLQICGVWPAKIGSFEERKFVHLIVIIYSIVVMLLSLYNAVVPVRIALFSTRFNSGVLLSNILLASSIIIDFLAKALIWYTAIFKYSAMKNCVESVKQGFSNSKFLVFIVAVAAGAQQGIVLCIAYLFTAMAIPNLQVLLLLYKSHTFTQTDTEAFLYFVAGSIANVLKSAHIPTALILGHCIGIVRELRAVNKILIQERKSDELYIEEN